MKQRGELHPSSPNLAFDTVEDALKRSNAKAPGVKNQIANGWDGFNRSEEAYREILAKTPLGWKRSDLTTETSLKLYCSFFDESTMLSQSQMTYVLGEELPGRKKDKATVSYPPQRKKTRGNAFSETKREGYRNSQSNCEKACRDVDIGSLFAPVSEYHNRICPGFEQINEDLYARKDNKFMVFNGAAVDSWEDKGREPLTKLVGIEADFLIG